MELSNAQKCRSYRLSHPDYKRDWRRRHPTRDQQWKANNPRKVQASRDKTERLRRAKLLERNSQESYKEMLRQRHDKSVEKERARQAKWQKENPDKVKAKQHNRRVRKLGNGGSFTGEQWKSLKDLHGNKCLCCFLTEPELLTLGRKLVPDHIRSIVNGGSNDISNIQPLCHGKGGCNNHKGTKFVDYR